MPSTPLARQPSLASLRPSFLLHLRAKNKSPKAIETHSDALDRFIAFLHRKGMPREVGSVRREREQVSKIETGDRATGTELIYLADSLDVQPAE